MTFRPFEDSPWSLRDLQDEIGKVVERVWQGAVPPGTFSGQPWMPRIDIYEYPDRYELYAEVPGLSGDDVEVSFLNQALTIKGEKQKPAAETGEARLLRNERRYGRFTRSVEVPGDINADRLTARCQAGVLQVVLPKAETAKGRSVKVEAGDGQ